MKFENLKTSLILNEDAEPTIELALRLAHLLFKDIAEEADVPDIVDCPAGVPGKFLKVLKRQCYITETICSGNFSIVEGYREELQGYLEDIRKMRAECESLEEQTAGMEDLEETLGNLRKALNTANKRKEDYAAMQAEKTALEEEIAGLQGDDPQPVQAELDLLRAERDRLRAEKAEKETKKTELESEVNQLKTEKNRIIVEISAFMQTVDELKTTLEQKRSDAEKWRSDKMAQEADVNAAEKTLEDLVNEYSTEKVTYDSLVDEKIPAQKKLVDSIKASVAEKTRELGDLNETLRTIRAKKAAADTEFGTLSTEKTNLTDALEQQKNAVAELENDIGDLKTEIDNLTAENHAARLEQLKKELESKRDDLQTVKGKCADTSANITEIEEQIQEKNAENMKNSGILAKKKRLLEEQDTLSKTIEEEIQRHNALLGPERELSEKLKNAGERLKYLEEQRRKLCDTIKSTAKYLGVPLEPSPEYDLYTNYRNLQKKNMEEIDRHIEELRRCLVETAGAL